MAVRSRLVTTVCAGTVVAFALTGCASNSEGPATAGTPSVPSGNGTASSASVSKDSSIAAMVPSDIASKGTLEVGVNVPYTPNEYTDSSGKVVGFDVDLLDAVAGVMGLKTHYNQSDFAKIIPAIQAGTYTIGMSSFTDTKQREQTVDFVDYFSAGTLWAQKAGGKTVNPDNACGLKVAVEKNTVQDTDDLPARNKKCLAAGKPAIQVQEYDEQDAATNALVLGRVDAMAADSPVTAYAIKQTGGKLVEAGKIYDSAPYGWPMKKGSGLVQAVQKAAQKLIDNGTYDSICKKWGVQDGEIKTASINGAQS